ncbi:MAG TPA: GFA family protein [Baekduia sp.]|nr:GFA family protein [Baekduia sp.]
MTDLNGRCLCGAVSFVVHQPQMLVECHCTRCRRWTGCASTPVVLAAAADLELTAGEELVATYAEEGFSPRSFCTRCGTSLYSGAADTRYVTAGVLEEPELEVACHVQVADKASWHEIGGIAPQHAALPG